MALINIIASFTFLLSACYALVVQCYPAAVCLCLCFLTNILYHGMLTYNIAYLRYMRIVEMSVCQLSGLYLLADLLFSDIYYSYTAPLLLCIGYCVRIYQIVMPLSPSRDTDKWHATIQVASNIGACMLINNKRYNMEISSLDDAI